MPTPKSTSNPQQYNGGINENIGPSQYVDGVYAEMDNIKLDINGRLKRDFGYDLYPSVTIPVFGISNYIPFAGTAPMSMPTGTMLENYIIRQDSSYTVSNQPILNIDGDTNNHSLFFQWQTPPPFNASYQDVRCIETFKNLYILSNNGTVSNPLLKFDYKYQYLNGYAAQSTSPDTNGTPPPAGTAITNAMTQNYCIAPVYTALDSYKPNCGSIGGELPNIGLSWGTYAYKYSFVSETGTESILSQQTVVNCPEVKGLGAIQPKFPNYHTDCSGFTVPWSNSLEPYNTTIKSIRIYRTHSSNTSDGYKINDADGNDPNIYWFVTEIPYTSNIFQQHIPSNPLTFTSCFLFRDRTPDTQLIDRYIELGLIPVQGNFGTYTDDRLHISGDLKYPNLVYVSEASTDAFRAQNTIAIPMANISNPVSGMASIQGVIYVFNKNFGICKLMPNGSGSSPYTVYPVSNNYGCDSPDSCINAGGMIYFVFNKHLYMFDRADIKDIGIPIQLTLDKAVSQIKLTYNVKKEYMYINVKDVNYNSIRLYCWSIRHKHFTSESLDLTATGDKKTRMDDVFFNRTGNFLMCAVSNPVSLIQAIFKETATYTIPLNWTQVAFMTTAPRQATIMKPLEPGTRGMLNRLTLYGINPAVYLNNNFIGSGMQLMLSKDGITFSNLMDASIATRRGADLRLNIVQEAFYLKFLWNTPSISMITNGIVGQEAVLDFWTYTFTAMASTSKQTTAGKLLQGS